MPQLAIRRLAAVDMYGTRGSTLRRRLIVASSSPARRSAVVLAAVQLRDRRTETSS
jgi:hypothetical protein